MDHAESLLADIEVFLEGKMGGRGAGSSISALGCFPADHVLVALVGALLFTLIVSYDSARAP